MNGWIAVDLDGTLAEYNGWCGPEHIGNPIPAMVERVKKWLAEGKDVRIFTARMYSDGTPERDMDAMRAVTAIQRWCFEQFGQPLPITNVKDYGMVEQWDDRAVQVRINTGKTIEEEKADLQRFVDSLDKEFSRL